MCYVCYFVRKGMYNTVRVQLFRVRSDFKLNVFQKSKNIIYCYVYVHTHIYNYIPCTCNSTSRIVWYVYVVNYLIMYSITERYMSPLIYTTCVILTILNYTHYEHVRKDVIQRTWLKRNIQVMYLSGAHMFTCVFIKQHKRSIPILLKINLPLPTYSID